MIEWQIVCLIAFSISSPGSTGNNSLDFELTCTVIDRIISVMKARNVTLQQQASCLLISRMFFHETISGH
jgi:hypothetical protein